MRGQTRSLLIALAIVPGFLIFAPRVSADTTHVYHQRAVSDPTTSTTVPTVVTHTTSVTETRQDQTLPPGAIKHPGEKCATVVQPPELQACPGPSDDVVPDGTTTGHHWCTGTPHALGECYAAEAGFFNPPNNFQPRNGEEACIVERENHDQYDRSSNPGHMGRWQDTESLYRNNGGQDDWNDPPSPAEQDMVAVNIITTDGYAPWGGYDGCG